MSKLRRFRFTGLALLLILPASIWAQVSITLKNEFIEKYKDRVTITNVEYIVDKAHPRPNSVSEGGKDGDLHFAGRAEVVGLATVSEVVNAKDESDALKLIHDAEGTGEPLRMDGVWRLWCEHSKKGSRHVQGGKLNQAENTNPDHVFEIHPVTRINGLDLTRSLKPIRGYKAKEADRAFDLFESKKCEIVPKSKTTTIVTSNIGYNYVEFIIEIGLIEEVDDGLLVVGNALDLNEELLVRDIRFAFVKGTMPERLAQDSKPGARLHVLGMPRISLKEVKRRVEHKNDDDEPLTWNLPYEIVVIGIY